MSEENRKALVYERRNSSTPKGGGETRLRLVTIHEEEQRLRRHRARLRDAERLKRRRRAVMTWGLGRSPSAQPPKLGATPDPNKRFLN